MADIAFTENAGAVTGGVRTLLRLEGLTLFAGMTLLYAVWDGSWWVYAILFLAPDLSFAAYLAGPKVGAIVYNAAHSYMAPVSLMVAGFALSSPLTLSISMIWMAHIGIDRALGYGLNTQRDLASPISAGSARTRPRRPDVALGYFLPSSNGGSLPGGTVSSAIASIIATKM